MYFMFCFPLCANPGPQCDADKFMYSPHLSTQEKSNISFTFVNTTILPDLMASVMAKVGPKQNPTFRE